jgi:hypothetical protein
MFVLTPKGHWQGDPAVACERLTVAAGSYDGARRLAALYRVLADPATRARLLDLAERVEAESADPAELVGC